MIGYNIINTGATLQLKTIKQTNINTSGIVPTIVIAQMFSRYSRPAHMFTTSARAS